MLKIDGLNPLCKIYEYDGLNCLTSINNGYDEAFGARPLKRLVSKTLEVLLAKKLINNEVKTIDVEEKLIT